MLETAQSLLVVSRAGCRSDFRWPSKSAFPSDTYAMLSWRDLPDRLARQHKILAGHGAERHQVAASPGKHIQSSHACSILVEELPVFPRESCTACAHVRTQSTCGLACLRLPLLHRFQPSLCIASIHTAYVQCVMDALVAWVDSRAASSPHCVATCTHSPFASNLLRSTE